MVDCAVLRWPAQCWNVILLLLLRLLLSSAHAQAASGRHQSRNRQQVGLPRLTSPARLQLAEAQPQQWRD